MNKGKIIFISLCLGVVSLLFYLFPYQFIRYSMLPEHKVRIEWTVYTNSGPIDYAGTYTMKGNKFRTMYTSHRGSNTVQVVDAEAITFIEKECVCIYVGTNDVNIKKVEIVE